MIMYINLQIFTAITKALDYHYKMNIKLLKKTGNKLCTSIKNNKRPTGCSWYSNPDLTLKRLPGALMVYGSLHHSDQIYGVLPFFF